MFATEQKLVHKFNFLIPYFVKKIVKKRFSDGFFINEFDSQNGIPDVVIGIMDFDAQTFEKRPGIRADWAFFLSKMNAGSEFTVESFMEFANFNRKQALQCLKGCCAAGFFEKNDFGVFKKIQEYKTSFKTLISIEAKLKDWKKALLQAYRYKAFSDYSFVLIDAAHVASSHKHIEMFEKFNVGLLSIDDENVYVHFVPKVQLPKEYGRFRLNEILVESKPSRIASKTIKKSIPTLQMFSATM